jgi:MSHA biogenesis protein MshJ
MKQFWEKLVLKVDAFSLRERIIIFAMVAVMVVVFMNTFVLDPQFAKQKLVSNKLKQEQSQIAIAQVQIQQQLTAQNSDPDAPNKARLAVLKQQIAQMQGNLNEMQKGLVSPDKMSALLEDIVRQNGKLRLVSLKTLPVSSLSELIEAETKASEKPADAAAASKDASKEKPLGASVYRHSVEIVIQGEYQDMMNYLTQLEAMPWQIFWGKAKLHVDEHPKSTLSLTLFTLSLDKKWLNL